MRRQRLQCLTTAVLSAPALKNVHYHLSSHPPLTTTPSLLLQCSNHVTSPLKTSPWHVPKFTGGGGTSPALFRPTRIERIPPQLARFLFAGGAALLQVFLVAFEREKRRLKYEADATDVAEGVGTKKRLMSGVEAVQVLGLDCSYPSLFNEIRKVEGGGGMGQCGASSSSSASSVLLPLPEGKAKEEAKRNFERMFALAIKEENLFLAGKLSAAYRVCVDPMWDRVGEVEESPRATPQKDSHNGN